MSKTSIIIHGHFYQPPRENPYSGRMPIQSTAKPYDDWNESIYSTCYRPNSASRYLNSNGKIDHIYNNYSRISVNMGQTLLDWIDEFHPVFLKLIKKADEESIKRYGHSSFMAQGYNHTIMPLDCEHTKRIQVVWAIESYKQRFGHDPEGFWLPECAIDNDTVDILAEYGIKFVVLAPWQAVAIDGKSTKGKPMPCDRPFIIRGNKGGELSAFFYNSEFASGVSFGHMLRDADSMFKRLLKLREEMGNPALISWATDGEIYGHHEPFGDMGLSALIRKIDASDELEIDNFASFLEKNPPIEVATLGSGDEGLGTSWSCSHGVGRWFRNCGCHTGGDDNWNQKWRGPLRDALNNLETAARTVIDNKVKEILGEGADYKNLTLDFKEVVSHKMDVRTFIDTLTKANGESLSEKEKVDIATVLEAFKNIMFSYASCGWFFNDISGIEPRQNISYAVYAAKLLDQYCHLNLYVNFLKDLEAAKSNIKSEGTGADIARKDVPTLDSKFNACGYFIMNRTIADPENYTDRWGYFQLEHWDDGSVTIVNTKTLKRSTIVYTKIPYTSGAISFVMTDTENDEKRRVNVLDASERSLRDFMSWISFRMSAGFPEEMVDTLAENIGNYLYLVATNRNLFKETFFTENIGICIKALKSLILSLPNMDEEKRLQRIRQISSFVKFKGRQVDIQAINDAFTSRLDKYAIDLLSDQSRTTLAVQALRLLYTARTEGFTPSITTLQDVFWALRNSSNIPENIKKALAMELNFMPMQSLN